MAINAAHVITENGGYPDARYGQDDTNLEIAYLLFLLVAIPFVIATFIVLLKQKQLTRISAWGAGLGTLIIAPLCVFFVLVLTGTDLG